MLMVGDAVIAVELCAHAHTHTQWHMMRYYHGNPYPGNRILRRDGSIYKKKRTGGKLESSSIPVIRKLNPTFNRKNLPIQEKKVNLVGYRSVDCSAFDDNLHVAKAAPVGSGDCANR